MYPTSEALEDFREPALLDRLELHLLFLRT
jgi:hypothetical protein